MCAECPNGHPYFVGEVNFFYNMLKNYTCIDFAFFSVENQWSRKLVESVGLLLEVSTISY